MKHTEKEKKAVETIQVFDLATNIVVIIDEEFEDLKKAHKVLLNLIKKQQKEITRLENIKNICPITNTSGIRCDLKEAGTTIAGADYSLDDYIPKEAIRKKILELIPIINKYNQQRENDEDTDLNCYEARAYACKLEAYKELLGE